MTHMIRFRSRTLLAVLASAAALAACGESSTEPEQIQDPDAPQEADTLRFSSITAGGRHTCALSPEMAAWCWGFGDDGALGPGLTGAIAVPQPVATELGFVALSAGSQHTCGVTEAGDLYCWGIGTWGTGSPEPQRVDGVTDIVQVSSAFGHVCVVIAPGTAGCFGVGDAGQLGSAHPVSAGPTQTVVEIPDLPSVVAVAAGKNHSCALDDAGVAWCWGADDAGQLGVGGAVDVCPIGPGGDDAPCSLIPVRVDADGPYVEIAAGLYHVCGLTESGRTECWGDDGSGQLGLDAGAPELCTWRVDAAGGPRPCARRPQPVDGEASFVTLQTGSFHTCGVTPSGAGACWGSNTFGQIGSGSETPGAGPEPLAGNFTWTDLAGGQVHSCGVAGSGAAYCWGGGSWGQLGSPTDQSPRPILVGGPSADGVG